MESYLRLAWRGPVEAWEEWGVEVLQVGEMEREAEAPVVKEACDLLQRSFDGRQEHVQRRSDGMVGSWKEVVRGRP